MHPSAYQNCKDFFETYSYSDNGNVVVVDIGSQNVNGTLKDHVPEEFKYIGVDSQEANGVDIILEDPYKLPFEDDSIDIVISSSCFEHFEFFWLVFIEIIRVLKPQGLFYLNAPSQGQYHKYPIDAWRFYPDSGYALRNYANRLGYKTALLESFIQKGGYWNDFVAVFLKDTSEILKYPNRIIHSRNDYYNGYTDHMILLNPLYSTERDEIDSGKTLNRFMSRIKLILKKLL